MQIAYVSRGYKRLTKGYILANSESTAIEIGDEAMQIKSKYKDIVVTVCENRKIAINNILKNFPQVDIVLLDDAFQHRSIKAGFNILVSDFNQPFFKDIILPSGNLRESKKSFKRAQHIMFSKCPSDLKKENIESGYWAFNTDCSFSYIYYSELKAFKVKDSIKLNNLKDMDVLLFTGIGNATYIESFLKLKVKKLVCMHFSDHHKYIENDVKQIVKRFNEFFDNNAIVVTTEKDFYRIKNTSTEKLFKTLPLYYLPIEIKIHDFSRQLFHDKILNYVGKN
jgi:tetraacyldisaccharide 4'-kinase